MPSPAAIDPAFLALPLDALADAALGHAKARGATYADFRLESLQRQTIVARDRGLQRSTVAESTGFAVRVIHKGAWGFASGIALTTDAAAAAGSRAIDVAETLAPLQAAPVVLADEPSHVDAFVSPYRIDPFTMPEDEKIAFVLALTAGARGRARVDHVTARVQLVSERKFFASMAGARLAQQRVRVAGDVTAARIDGSTGTFETMRTTVPPAGSGWEYLAESSLAQQAEELPALLEEKMASPPIAPGRYDLVVDATNLWLTLHETIGHATELDRALGYEANYAGTSFATPEGIDRLRIGSSLMHVTADRQVPHGLSTVGYDDEGVAAQSWDLVRGGVLTGFQLNREMAHRLGAARSNGCAFADAPEHAPLQRMPNVSLLPAPTDITLDDLLAGVDDGIYVVGDRSWSIDAVRSNFQFTGQRFYRIRNGRLAGQLRDVAYRSRTTEFWNAMDAVGGPSTYVPCGLFHCGKGEPPQSAPATHGCPAALFRGIDVLNTEGRSSTS